jgi:hypothetical protein
MTSILDWLSPSRTVDSLGNLLRRPGYSVPSFGGHSAIQAPRGSL